MCAYIQKVHTDTKFVILMHPKEFKKVKNNTGRFTHLSLPNSELFVGIDFSNHSRINEIIATHESYVLFPSKDATDLSKEAPKNLKRALALFVIDATWACTKSIFKSSGNLQLLPHMSFTTSRTSQYQIKMQPQEGYLSTMESVHVVLELLAKHGMERIEPQQLQNFLRPFVEMVRYQKELLQNPKSNAVRFFRK